MKQRKISFLIEANNEEKIIARTLRNLSELPYDNYEVLIGLDGFKVLRIRAYDNPYVTDSSLTYRFTYRDKKNFIELIIFSSVLKLFFTPISLVVTYLNLGSLMEIECTKN